MLIVMTSENAHSNDPHAEDAYLSILRMQMFRFKLQLFSSSAEASPLSYACHLTPVSL